MKVSAVLYSFPSFHEDVTGKYVMRIRDDCLKCLKQKQNMVSSVGHIFTYIDTRTSRYVVEPGDLVRSVRYKTASATEDLEHA